jgi:hypothetical protein
LERPRRERIRDGRAQVSFVLPRQAVSLVRLSW